MPGVVGLSLGKGWAFGRHGIVADLTTTTGVVSAFCRMVFGYGVGCPRITTGVKMLRRRNPPAHESNET
jgi:hypothetical protein